MLLLSVAAVAKGLRHQLSLHATSRVLLTVASTNPINFEPVSQDSNPLVHCTTIVEVYQAKLSGIS